MFIDKAKIHLEAGDGGNGCVSFRREKFVPMGGPDGGDGGNGGDIILIATSRKNTLLDFQYKRNFKSENGRPGQGGKRTGRTGSNLEIPVPVGTVALDESGEIVLADMNHEGASFLVAKGGKGGRGNAKFATPTAQAPAFAEEGTEGEECTLVLELKLIADVGLLGFPNAGKSTLLSKISAAKPKIASYPFTTLQPVLGTVEIDDRTTIIVADIPGLIEGASQGHGLGLQFLRHIERTRLLLHLVDVSAGQEPEPVARYRAIRKELSLYGKGLSEKPEVIVATKLDIQDPISHEKLKRLAARKNIPFVTISAETGEGLKDLLAILKVHTLGFRSGNDKRIPIN